VRKSAARCSYRAGSGNHSTPSSPARPARARGAAFPARPGFEGKLERGLSGFIWAIGVTVEREQWQFSVIDRGVADHEARKAAHGGNDGGEGHTKGAPSIGYAAGVRVEPRWWPQRSAVVALRATPRASATRGGRRGVPSSSSDARVPGWAPFECRGELAANNS